MPLTQPSGGGIDRRLYTTVKQAFSRGADTGIAFLAGVYDGDNDRGIIGGDGSFVGFITDLTKNKIDQAATLPSSVIVGLVDCERVRLNYNSANLGEIMITDTAVSQAVVISADSGASWTDIGQNMRAAPAQDICSWRDQLIALFSATTNCDLSSDNGATFPTTFDTQLPGPSQTAQFLFTDPAQTVLVSAGNTGLSCCFEDDVTIPANWNSFTAPGVTSGWRSVAIADDASSAVAVAVAGAIFHTTDFITWTAIPTDDNPFLNGSGPLPVAPDSVVFIDDLDGYLLINDATPAIVAFIAETDLTTVLVGSHLGSDVFAFPATEPIGFSDGENLWIRCNGNDVITTLELST